MARKQKHSRENKLKIVKEIAYKVINSSEDIKTICLSCGVPYKTFYNWFNTDKEISKIYEDAKMKYTKNKKIRLRELALNSLEQNLNGYRFTKKKTKKDVNSDGTTSISEIEEEVFIKPSDTAIALTLNNLDPDFNRDVMDGNSTVTVTIKPKSLDIKDEKTDDEEQE